MSKKNDKTPKQTWTKGQFVERIAELEGMLAIAKLVFDMMAMDSTRTPYVPWNQLADHIRDMLSQEANEVVEEMDEEMAAAFKGMEDKLKMM